MFTPPKSFRARPTTDYARESLFNILVTRYDFTDLKVLDLFAGTGAVSLEFASREAEKVVAVERDYHHFNFINKLVTEWHVDNMTVIKGDVRDFLRNSKLKFDLVFADPPYELKWLTEIPDIVLSSGILNKDALFILEHPDGLSFDDHPAFSEHRYYGNVNFSFFHPLPNGGK